MLIPIDKLLSADELATFRRQIEAGPWQDGTATAGAIARSVKHNRQLDPQSALAQRLGDHIRQRLAASPRFVSAALPRRIHPPRFNLYTDGGHYGLHIDSALMQASADEVPIRTDLSATLFLSDPDSYDGGELQIEGPFGVQSVKLPAGDVILYPSSSLHRVTPVTRGSRLASFFWIESLVRDDSARTLLFDLDQAIQGLSARQPADDPHCLALTGVYHNLLRRWAQT